MGATPESYPSDLIRRSAIRDQHSAHRFPTASQAAPTLGAACDAASRSNLAPIRMRRIWSQGIARGPAQVPVRLHPDPERKPREDGGKGAEAPTLRPDGVHNDVAVREQELA